MAVFPDDVLVVAISSRALFDLEDENDIYEQSGPDAYEAYQLSRLDESAKPGVAFPLVQKLLRLNEPDVRRVEVVVLSRNDPVSGLRVFRSAESHELNIVRGAFTRGRSPFRYLRPLGAKLFLSAAEDDVRQALGAGVPAARVYKNPGNRPNTYPDEIRIAFDGDAVLFGDEAERIYQEQGLEAFQANEVDLASVPLAAGPFMPFLKALHALQKKMPFQSGVSVRTALVTARNAPAHERAIRTLMSWDVEVDESFFLGGLAKGEFLAEWEPDFFFDDQTKHCESAAGGSPTGHVTYGVNNIVALGGS